MFQHINGNKILFILLISGLSFVCGKRVDNPCEPPYDNRIPCDNEQCIERTYWCDNFADCSDKSDEQFCRRDSSNDCTDKHFTCGNGICIPISLRCDGHNDCKDGTDEDKCDILNSDQSTNKSDIFVASTMEAVSAENFTDRFRSTRRHGICSWMVYKDSTCIRTKFLCSNKKCIDRHLYCNGVDDCGDNSDESFCKSYGHCQTGKLLRRCDLKCIPEGWFCDGIADCEDGLDEAICYERKYTARLKADKIYSAITQGVKWIHNQSKPESTTDVWGSCADKIAVALYFSDPSFLNFKSGLKKSIADEVSILLLSRLLRTKLQDIPSTDLASFVNAFLVSCVDPRKFHGIDIIQELRNRVDKENKTNPYVLLSLCNAGEIITESDKAKLIDTFWNKRRIFWTDMQAITVMALACASQQTGNNSDIETLRELTTELKKCQHKNGTVGNLQTTALVLQALFATQPDEDPDSFDEKRVIEEIISKQNLDGSFGNLINTYFVLPVLGCNTLVNISSNHCKSVESDDEMSVLYDLANQTGPKKRVQYSLWIGDEKYMERNLILRVPENTSFYGIMETAAKIDDKYSFQYVIENNKPYINAISGLQDNPEKEKFWSLYTIKDGQPEVTNESPADVMPLDNDHFVMWYRSE